MAVDAMRAPHNSRTMSANAAATVAGTYRAKGRGPVRREIDTSGVRSVVLRETPRTSAYAGRVCISDAQVVRHCGKRGVFLSRRRASHRLAHRKQR